MTLNKLGAEVETKIPSPAAGPKMAKPPLWSAIDIERPIATRFEQIATFYPDRLAVAGGGQKLTYDQLNRAANRLAHAIQTELGNDMEPVAIRMEHGVQLIVTVLALLKAGKFFVPLDTMHPEERIRSILEHAGCRLLLTDRQGMAQIKMEGRGLRLMDVGAISPDLPEQNLNLPLSSDTLLNLMYTSGSTGAPKGVMQTQRNLLHEVWSSTDDLHLSADDHVALVISLSFGVATVQLFLALLNGASLHTFDVKQHGAAAAARWLVEEQITIYHSVPTIYRHLLALLESTARFPQMRAVLLGGEAILQQDLLSFRQHFPPHCIFRSGLGTTETYLVAQYLLTPESEIPARVLPVGYVTRDKEVLLLDAEGNHVPDGEIGEIAVVSRYISPGYWRQPEQTAAAFLATIDGTGRRMYLTGDLGRWRTDGLLEHVGRKDFQVKIRGHRIEPSEIESHLLDLPGIEEAVVIARQDPQGETRLVAYIVPAGDELDLLVLRRSLALKLPEPMVPSLFVLIDHFLLLPFGKIDRLALPAPDWGHSMFSQSAVAPRTPVEQALAEQWAQLLGLQSVGVYDHFFDLGGTSLLAARVISQVNADYGIELAPAALFETPTVAELALAVTQQLAGQLEQGEMARLVADVEALEDGSTNNLFQAEH